MAGPLHSVAETASYLRDAKEAGLTRAEMDAIVTAVARYPGAGDEVAGTGGVRKQRHGSAGRGKRGSFRVMVAWVDADAPVYLLAILKKNERADFSAEERAAMKAAISRIRDSWRKRLRHTRGTKETAR